MSWVLDCKELSISIFVRIIPGVLGLDFVVAIGKDKSVRIDLGFEGEFGAKYWSNQLLLTISQDF